ncbi:MAG: ribosome biogenesis GTP-binding protein YihA/YsxC [Candidatus Auribacterota bacterium]
MKITSVEFHMPASKPELFCFDLPQVVFAGRSNVGKSSLIKTLMNRKKMVRVGRTPGVTRAINFFKINERYYFVDLPGYGYAKAPPAEQNKWKKLIEAYFNKVVNLRKIVLLLDIRRELTPGDQMFLEWARNFEFPLLVVLTKMDKVSKNEAVKRRSEIIKACGLPAEDCILFSALKGTGKEDILMNIGHALANNEN